MTEELWKNNDIQFPRLLAEIMGVGLTDEQYTELGATMDLSSDEIDELLERADREWHRHKYGDDFDYDGEFRNLTPTERVRRTYFDDPLMDDATYGKLMEEAVEQERHDALKAEQPEEEV